MEQPNITTTTNTTSIQIQRTLTPSVEPLSGVDNDTRGVSLPCIPSRNSPTQMEQPNITTPTNTTSIQIQPTRTSSGVDNDTPGGFSLPCIPSILTRFHAGYFRITLSLGGQALLWKNLIEPTSPNKDINPLIYHIFHRFHPITFISFWTSSLLILIILSTIYLLRCIFHLDLVKAEFLHHVGVNYLFAPWISWLLLLQCSPWVLPGSAPYLGAWWALVVPVVGLDLKIYGQWFTTKGPKYKLTAVANPTSQMTVIGNLVGARAAAIMGWGETAMVLFSLGMVHYLVVFVTLYQRISGSEHEVPAMLRPVFFLFFAAPGMASLAWDSIAGRFDTAAKMLFFLSIFLFTSLVCRPLLFKRAMKRFNVTWWAYPFPITVLAIAATEYAEEVEGKLADLLMMILAALSFLVTFILVLFSLFNSKMLLPDHDPLLNNTTSVFSDHDDHHLPTTVHTDVIMDFTNQ